MGPVWVALLSCRAPESDSGTPTDTVDTRTDTNTDTQPTDTTTDTAATDTAATTGDTAAVGGCDELLLAPPFTNTESDLILTEEDFDFDIQGLLVTQANTDLVGYSSVGQLQVVATNIGIDIAGVRSLPSGDIVVAVQDTGSVRRVTRSTGGSITVVSGLDFPNGLDVGTDGMAYVSDYTANGKVVMFDPYTGFTETIIQIAYPNGIALSADEQTLYMATSDNLFSGTGRIAAIDRDAAGDWDASTVREIHQSAELLDAITVDVCGNVYFVEYTTGRVLRVRASDWSVEPLLDLPNVGFEGYSAARFGPGIGGWLRTTFYVSDRFGVFAIPLGIEGRHVLAVESTDTGTP